MLENPVWTVDPDNNIDNVNLFSEMFKWIEEAFMTEIVEDIDGSLY
jgi:hypothetical protein